MFATRCQIQVITEIQISIIIISNITLVSLFLCYSIRAGRAIQHSHVISELGIDGTSSLRLVFMMKTGFLGTLSIST